jgi:hypothetical protein
VDRFGKKILIIQLMSLLLSGVSWSHSGEEFCKTYLEIQNISQKKISLYEGLKLAFFPSSIINPIELSDEHTSLTEVKNSSEDIRRTVFVHLPKRNFDLEKIRKIKKREKEIAKLRLFSDLKNTENLNSCLETLAKNSRDFQEVQDYLNFYLSSQDQLEAYTESKALKVLNIKLRAFERDGWRIKFVKNMKAMYEDLEDDLNVEEVLIIAHSDQAGRIYDAKKNIFPKGAFSNLPSTIKKLMIYSCHSEKVVEFYQIKRYLQKFDFYYPQVEKRFIAHFESKIPLLSVRSFKNIKSHRKSSFEIHQRLCQLETSGDEKIDGIAVSLNDQFLGFINLKKANSLSFDCRLLNAQKNQFKFYDYDNSTRQNLGHLEVSLLNEDGNKRNIKLKEYRTWDQKNHLLTIGI